jgi:error-prone DNA polymerase
VRDVGKALGLPEDMAKILSSNAWGWGEDVGEKHAAELNLNLGDRVGQGRYRHPVMSG